MMKSKPKYKIYNSLNKVNTMTTETLTLRRKTAIQQLEKQLELGTKPNKALKAPVGMTRTAFKKANPRLPLTKKDERRIRNTIAILHTKLKFHANR